MSRFLITICVLLLVSVHLDAAATGSVTCVGNASSKCNGDDCTIKCGDGSTKKISCPKGVSTSGNGKTTVVACSKGMPACFPFCKK